MNETHDFHLCSVMNYMDCAELIGWREFLLDLFDLQYILTFSIEVMMMDYNKQNLLRIVSSEIITHLKQ